MFNIRTKLAVKLAVNEKIIFLNPDKFWSKEPMFFVHQK